MSKQLGVGVRVFVGWTPNSRMSKHMRADPRLKTGTISSGPYFEGDTLTFNTGESFLLKGDFVRWVVDIDGSGQTGARESLLTPIDDDSESVTRLAELETSE